MDQIENLYENQRESLDRLVPSPNLWEEISAEVATLRKRRRWMTIVSSFAALILVLAIVGGVYKTNKKASLRAGIDIDHISPDIVMESPNGEPIALSSLEGKVVLVEFWASWCNVCREKNCEELLPLYDQYKDKGFEIYAISVDQNKYHWENGIETHNLPWIHVSDFQGFASPVSQRYGVTQTPATFLLDENRRVLGKNLTREDLEKKLSQCYDGCDENR